MLSRSLQKLCFATCQRTMGGGSGPVAKGTYDTGLLHLEKQKIEDAKYEAKLKAEKKLVEDLTNAHDLQSYNPSLEPGTINLKKVDVPYYSVLLRAQTAEQTAAAKANIDMWQQKFKDETGSKTELVKQIIAETPLLFVTWEVQHSIKYYWEQNVYTILRHHGIMSGVEGYVPFKHYGDEELMEEFVEISGCTHFPQMYAGGKFVGQWRDLTLMHNSGEMVAVLGSVGMRSKMKGAYYYDNTAMVMH